VGVMSSFFLQRLDLLSRSRIDHLAHLGHPIQRKSSLLGMFLQHRFIRSDVQAVNPVVGNIGVQPLDFGTQLA